MKVKKNRANAHSVMSKIICLVMIAVATTIFGGCEKKDNKENSNKEKLDLPEYADCEDIQSETSLFSTLKLNVIYDRINYNYAKVYVYYSNYETISLFPPTYNIVDGIEPVTKSFLVAEAEGKNPILKFKDVPDEYLINILKKTDSYYGLYHLIRDDYEESSITISNENAKVAVVETISTSGTGYVNVEGVFLSGEPVNMFSEWGWSIGGRLVYCNADCNITGKLSWGTTIDIRLKKGWNKIFTINCSNNVSDSKVITLGTDNVVFYCVAG
ncbi:hypothetical protein FACS189434_04540 [Bacteroidia bacterium]|nr:hypothetical protein FACS189434_04540 [Bacteroidia bacterium]